MWLQYSDRRCLFSIEEKLLDAQNFDFALKNSPEWVFSIQPKFVILDDNLRTKKFFRQFSGGQKLEGGGQLPLLPLPRHEFWIFTRQEDASEMTPQEKAPEAVSKDDDDSDSKHQSILQTKLRKVVLLIGKAG